MVKGDIVLITFPFTNLKGSKLRPAVVLYHTKSDLTACFISSQIQWEESTDILLSPKKENGLKKSSLVKASKVATLDRKLAKGLLGRLNQIEIGELNNRLKMIFQLS